MDCAFSDRRGYTPPSDDLLNAKAMQALQGTLNSVSESVRKVEIEIHTMIRQQEAERGARRAEIESSIAKSLGPLDQQLSKIEQALNQTVRSQIAGSVHLGSLGNQGEAIARVETRLNGLWEKTNELLAKSREEPKLIERAVEYPQNDTALHMMRAHNDQRDQHMVQAHDDQKEFFLMLPDVLTKNVADVLHEKLKKDLSDLILNKLPAKLRANHGHVSSVADEFEISQLAKPASTETAASRVPIIPTMPPIPPANMPDARPDPPEPGVVDDFLYSERIGKSHTELNVDLTMGEKKGTRLSMCADANIDESKVVLAEDHSLGAVFTTDTDPETPPYSVEMYYKKHGCFQAIARDHRFADLTVLVVAMNAVYLGIESDHNKAENLYDAKLPFFLASQFFCVYFVGELLIRFLAFEKKKECLRDGWFKFDLFLVVTMVMDSWVLMPILKVLSGDGNTVQIPTQPLRMLRLFKLTRMARLMKAFPELITMIKGLVRSLRAIASSGVLVLLMMYTWAILIHMLLGDDDSFNRNIKSVYDYEFSTIIDCMWTLFMTGTLMLDNASPMMTTLLFSPDPVRVMAGLALISYCFLSALLILQMLIGVLCDVVSQVGKEKRDSDCVGLLRQELLGDLKKYDDGDGKLSKKEFEAQMENDHSKAALKKLNINRLFLLEVAGMMFPDDDSQVPIRTVLDLMLMCKGDNVVSVQIIASALCFLSNEIADLHEKMVFHIDVASASEPSGRNQSFHSARSKRKELLQDTIGLNSSLV